MALGPRRRRRVLLSLDHRLSLEMILHLDSCTSACRRDHESRSDTSPEEKKEEKRRCIPSTLLKLSRAISSTSCIITQYPYPSSPPIPALLSPTSNPKPLANFLLNAIFKNNSLAKLLVILMNVSELTLPAPTARCKHHNASLMAASSAWRFQS